MNIYRDPVSKAIVRCEHEYIMDVGALTIPTIITALLFVQILISSAERSPIILFGVAGVYVAMSVLSIYLNYRRWLTSKIGESDCKKLLNLFEHSDLGGVEGYFHENPKDPKDFTNRDLMFLFRRIFPTIHK